MTSLGGTMAASSWNGHDTRLIVAAVIGVALIVVPWSPGGPAVRWC
jgi:hypothetical protein